MSTTQISIDIDFIRTMRHSPIRNYVVPGVTSWILGSPSLSGCVRMLECDRDQIESVAPHDHRFAFHAVVLSGVVCNRLWKPAMMSGDLYQSTVNEYTGIPGRYVTRRGGEVQGWDWSDTHFRAGESYGMEAHEVHSITFRRGTSVLIFEGMQQKTVSTILEPVVDGKVCSSFHVEPWMFQREVKGG